MINQAVFIVCLLWSWCFCGFAQSGWYQEAGFGITFNLNEGFPGKKRSQHRFPGYKISANFNAQYVAKSGVLVSYGGTLSLYNKSLGNSLNIVEDDIQLDFANSFSAGHGFDRTVGFRKRLRTIGNSASYNLTHDREYYVGISSIYIWNVNGRNQYVGAVSATLDRISFTYYNDGGPPISWLPISDGFDRYWTSGAHVFVHSKYAVNHGELSFDQFTGYTPMLYELATLLGINVGEYTTNDQQALKTNSSYNSTQYNLRINLRDGFSINAGVLGSLIVNSKKGWRYFGLQDVIHLNHKFALHPNSDVNRIFLGVNYDGAIWKN